MDTAPGNAPLAAAYRVRATRWARGWELSVTTDEHGEVGVTTTRGRNLADAAEMVRDFLAVTHDLTETEAAGIAIEVMPDLGAEADERIRNARTLAAEAEAARDAAAAASRDVVKFLDELGLSGREIAIVLGLSAQRVSQLLNAA